MEALVFAQKFPFSERAKNYLKESKLSIEDVSESEIKRAALIISRAFSGKNYVLDAINAGDEIYKREIIAYPISKLIISAMSTKNIKEKFADLIRKKTFSEIVNDTNSKDICLDLADDFKLKYELEESFFVSINLLDYLENYFIDEETKIVNKIVSNGKVYLNINDFARFLSEKAYAKVVESLPIQGENIPKKFVQLAKNISSQVYSLQQKDFEEKISGKIDPNLFSPSMKNLYEKQLSGEKLTYYERLAIGGFLQQIGMQKQEMLNFFSKSPDFKKHIAEYHINRIYEKGLSAPSYKKMDEFGIIVSREEKKFVHPVKYYLVQLREKNRKKNFGANKNV